MVRLGIIEAENVGLVLFRRRSPERGTWLSLDTSRARLRPGVGGCDHAAAGDGRRQTHVRAPIPHDVSLGM